MCRILAYLGEPLPVRSLLYDTDNSLVRQSYSPQDDEHVPQPRGVRHEGLGHHLAAPGGSVHVPLHGPAVVRSQPAFAVVEARAVVRRSPTSAGSRTPTRRSSPTPTCIRSSSAARRSCSPTTGTCASSRACATRSSSTSAPSSPSGSRARPTRSGSTRSSCRSSPTPTACRRRANSPMRPSPRCASCAPCARPTTSTPPHPSTCSSAPAAPWSPPASRSTTAGIRRRTRCSRPTCRS